MNIGILAVDSNYPNLALMKISSYHKARGDNVEWYNPLCSYDKVYIAKVFSFTPDYGYYINADQVEKGGTGYDIKKVLLPEIDRMIPDYDLYNVDKNFYYTGFSNDIFRKIDRHGYCGCICWAKKCDSHG